MKVTTKKTDCWDEKLSVFIYWNCRSFWCLKYYSLWFYKRAGG